jgi:L-arabinose isomerase
MLPHHTPRIGVIGIMQELYDDMLPGITERQGRYLADVAAALGSVAETVVEPPARNRADVERWCARTRTPTSTACSS